MYNSPEITHPMNAENVIGFEKDGITTSDIPIQNIDLEENDIFHYLFDFGDEWWHRIRVQGVTETKSGKKHIGITKKVGASPQQYSHWDDDFDEEDE
jgi:hypothetical protein